MRKLTDQTLAMMEQFVQGKPHLLLTLGLIENGETQVRTFNQRGETDPAEDAIYELGSVTKVFTTSLLAKRLDQGRISLDDTIDKYMKDLPEGLNYPTVEQLATHRAGYGGVPFETRMQAMTLVLVGDMKRRNPYLRYDLDWLRSIIVGRAQQPREQYSWAYSNAGMSILGHILAELEHKPYSEAIMDFVRDELGLQSTVYGTDPQRSLRGYHGKKDCGNYSWKGSAMEPAGCLSASARDLLTFLDLHMHGGRPYLQTCHEVYTEAGTGADMGLGWVINRGNGVRWHNGGTGCFTSVIGFDPARALGVVLLSNSKGGSSRITVEEIANSIFLV